jgi:hypothetical protein
MEQARIEKSFLNIIRLSTIHCNRFRKRAFDDRSVPDQELGKIASAMLDLFEKEMEQTMRKRRATPASNGGEKSPKKRI